jgi:hypothetical protein
MAPGGYTTARSSRRWRRPKMVRAYFSEVDKRAGVITEVYGVRRHRKPGGFDFRGPACWPWQRSIYRDVQRDRRAHRALRKRRRGWA